MARSSAMLSAPAPTPASTTRAPGKRSAQIKYRPKVFGIDDLGVARQIGNKLWKTRAENQERLVHRGTDHTAFVMTDDIFDGNFSTADGDGPVSIEPRQVFSVFAVQAKPPARFLGTVLVRLLDSQ